MTENRIKIELHTTDSLRYRILILRERTFLYFWKSFYWENVENFLELRARGVWNPILLPYDQAKELALKMKNKEYFDSFIENEKLKEQQYLNHRGTICPVLSEEL